VSDEIERIESVSASSSLSVQIGKEKEFIGHRLNDIIFLAEKTTPVENDWEGYAKACLHMIARQAREARTLLEIAPPPRNSIDARLERLRSKMQTS